MCQLDKLQRLRDEIYQIVRKHKAEKLYVFGSCARKDETPQSDIDFIVDFKEHASIFDHAGLEYDLSRLLGCKVDVVAEKALKEDLFAANVKRDMVLIS